MTSDATWASLVAPREEDDNDDKSIPSLQSYGINTKSDDESDFDPAIDMTRLYRYGELEDE